MAVLSWIPLCGFGVFYLSNAFSPPVTLLLMVISMGAAAALIAIVDVCQPKSAVLRFTVYACAMVAVVLPWTVVAVTWFVGYQGVLPETPTEPVFVRVTWRYALFTCVAALASLPPFWIVRRWVTRGRQLSTSVRAPFSERIRTAGFVATAALAGLFLADGVDKELGGALGVIDGPGSWSIPRDMSSVVWQLVSDVFAGLQEEPILIGVVMLLWPRLQARTFAMALALVVLVRLSYHLYYAADFTSLAAVLLWCVVWSAISLALLYRFRLLWPIAVASGLYLAHLRLYEVSRSGPPLPDALVVVWVLVPVLLCVLSIWYLSVQFGRRLAVEKVS